MFQIFNNKVVVITGASSGIGAELAIKLLQTGAFVAVCARQIEKFSQLNINTNNPKLLIVKADVAIENECKNLIEQTIQQFKTIDILINNAGISMRAMFADVDLQVLKSLMNINFWGTVYCTKYALPYIKQNKGSIVAISSIAGYRGLPCRTGYSASKFAMQGFMESLRTELLHTGVQVLTVSPGFVASNIRNTALNSSGNSQAETPLDENKLMSTEECATRILKGIVSNKKTIIMTLQGKLTVLTNKLFPRLADKLVYNHFKNEADSPLK
jgi:short-subunit dehydrogenase